MEKIPQKFGHLRVSLLCLCLFAGLSACSSVRQTVQERPLQVTLLLAPGEESLLPDALGGLPVENICFLPAGENEISRFKGLLMVQLKVAGREELACLQTRLQQHGLNPTAITWQE